MFWSKPRGGGQALSVFRKTGVPGSGELLNRVARCHACSLAKVLQSLPVQSSCTSTHTGFPGFPGALKLAKGVQLSFGKTLPTLKTYGKRRVFDDCSTGTIENLMLSLPALFAPSIS